jgi:hypothetical protein
MLVGVLIDLSRCGSFFLGKLEAETGIIGLFKNIGEFMLAPHHMRNRLVCAGNRRRLF